MGDMTSLLDDSWSNGRNNFDQRKSGNFYTPGLADVRWDNSRSLLENVATRDVSARGLSLLDQFNKYFQMKESVEFTIKAMEAYRVAEKIRDQLSPQQQVVLLVDRNSGKETLLRAGEAILYNPSERPFVFTIRGNDGGVCRGNEIEETVRFQVNGKHGEKEWLILDGDPSLDRKDKVDERERTEEDFDRGRRNPSDEDED